MRKAEEYSDCRRTLFGEDDKVWQKKRNPGSMMWTTNQKPVQNCGKERNMTEQILQKDGGDRPDGENVLFKLPKHIKQMGKGGNSPEIYIEDYAEGYLRRLAGNDYADCRVAVLVGEFVKAEGRRYVFIRGAIEAEEAVKNNEICFTSEVWAGVYEKMKRFFPHYEAVGWFLGGPEYVTEVNESIVQMHTDWFGGRDRVLYKVDPVEKEAVFYLYDKGDLKRWPGYCIYYERNEEMQEYLVAGGRPSVDAAYKEPVMDELRRQVNKNREEESEHSENESEQSAPVITERPKRRDTGSSAGKKTTTGHGAGVAVAVVLLAIGVLALQEREKNKNRTTLSPTSAPAPVGYIQGGADEGALQVNANAGGETLPEQKEKLSDLETDFIPLTEAPYNPGKRRELTSTPIPPVSTMIPTPEPVKTPTPVPKQEEDADAVPLNVYIVQRGDTLAGICKAFYGSTARMEEIKGINQIPDENWIYAGQELLLP